MAIGLGGCMSEAKAGRVEVTEEQQHGLPQGSSEAVGRHLRCWCLEGNVVSK